MLRMNVYIGSWIKLNTSMILFRLRMLSLVGSNGGLLLSSVVNVNVSVNVLVIPSCLLPGWRSTALTEHNRFRPTRHQPHSDAIKPTPNSSTEHSQREPRAHVRTYTTDAACPPCCWLNAIPSVPIVSFVLAVEESPIGANTETDTETAPLQAVVTNIRRI